MSMAGQRRRTARKRQGKKKPDLITAEPEDSARSALLARLVVDRSEPKLSPSHLLERQGMVGNQVVARTLGKQQIVRAKQDAGVVGREPISIEIVDAPAKKKGTIKDIVLDSLNTVEAMMNNYTGALENFETVVSNSSKEEAKLKDSSAIALEVVGKFVLDKAKSFAYDLMPGGKYAKEIIGLATSIGEAIEKEKKRSAAAMQENALKDFITGLRTKITEAESNLMAAKQDDAVEAQDKYDKKPTQSEKDGYRDYIEYRNHEITSVFQQFFSINALFTRITEAWINQTQAPGKGAPSMVYINMDKNWNVIGAYVDAPRGSRLAEQLLQTGGGDVELASLDVKRRITWFPAEGEGSGLARVWADVNAAGQIEEIAAWHFGKPYIEQFKALVSSKPVPATTKLTGVKKS